jgi:hypothetical protein
MSDDKVGSKQPVDSISTSSVTVSGVAVLIPTSARRSHIKIKNVGGIEISIITSLDDLATDGYPVAASGGEFVDDTNAPLYAISTGAASELRIYERSNRNIKKY